MTSQLEVDRLGKNVPHWPAFRTNSEVWWPPFSETTERKRNQSNILLTVSYYEFLRRNYQL